MLQHTLVFYLIAGILSLVLGVVTLVFTRLQRGTVLAQTWAVTILVLGTAFVASGIGPLLPRWVTVIGTNMVLLSGGTLLYSGFVAYRDGTPLRPDPFGLLVLVAVLPAFWYWGLIAPDGLRRSIAFSLAAAAINSRSAMLLLHPGRGGAPLRVIGALFSVLTAWMLLRAVLLIAGDAPVAVEKGANPTTWPTVAGYIVLMAANTLAVIWLELRQIGARRESDRGDGALMAIPQARSKLLLLWSSFAVIAAVILSELWLAYNAVENPAAAHLPGIALTALTGIVVLAVFATLLTIEIRRRDEQDRFMAMLNHELKTPLAVIRLSLGGSGIPEAVRERVARVVGEMDAIIQRSIQADRLRHGRVRAKRRELQIGETLGALRAASSVPERLQVTCPELPPCCTDYQLLDVILSNLVDNALKYGAPDSTVSIEAAAEGDGIRIAVANPPGAAGMPDPRKVFRKYYRAPAAHGKTGSGLGLHIAEGFARMLGGSLRYCPTADTVKFELWIPR